jgi:quercetin dioxygenase-like cupin family protein
MTAAMDLRPLVIGRGAGEAVWFLGQPIEIVITGEQTGGAYAVTRAEPAPGFAPAPHVHNREDEAIYLVSGELVVTLGDEQVSVVPGTLIHIPRGTRHTHENSGASPALMLSIYCPAGFEQIFKELGEPIIDRAAGPSEAPDTARLAQRAPAYGLDIGASAG